MKIGIVVEGSYPYVSGGVASWVHMIANRMPQFEFQIIAITPSQLTEKDYRYELPSNITGITNLPLNMKQPNSKQKIQLTPFEEEALTDWMMFRKVTPEALHVFTTKLGGTNSFFSSRLFWNMVQESYQQESQTGSFIDYFWMWRGMYTPILELLQFDFPEVDLVHSASTGYAGLISAAIKQQQNIPFLLTEHGIYSREREEEILQASWIPDYYKKRWISFFHHLSKQAYEEADDVITLFDKNSDLQNELGAVSEKRSVIPNGIHYERLSSIEKIQGDNKVLRIGAIVRVVPIKDIKTMIHAAKLLQETETPFELTIMGPLDEEEEYAAECQQLIDQHELNQSVFLVGKVNIIDYLPNFDLCLLTSISEGQPLAVLEGMAAAIPWIVTDVGSCSELIYGRENDPYGPAGFVVPPVNPKKIAEYCTWFYHHPIEAEKFGRNGQNRAKTFYQVHHFIDQYVDLYERRGAEYGRNRI
ncbi:GT4 family glycosyltransferase PelF [Pseudalkalibacillus sp. JSM 102089]|uniref:GT4 family glycosyltransferase PelF n=1 Tax=Pseudalkalibacillus sp. JSM 102089 TaxID=3229856 RepID=UPI00352642E0